MKIPASSVGVWAAEDLVDVLEEGQVAMVQLQDEFLSNRGSPACNLLSNTFAISVARQVWVDALIGVLVRRFSAAQGTGGLARFRSKATNKTR